MAIDTISRLESQDRKRIFSYIGEYCQDLIRKDGTFEVGNEESLKRVLFGIEQRFYTTPVGKEKRLANSIINDSPDIIILDLNIPESDAILFMNEMKDRLVL